MTNIKKTIEGLKVLEAKATPGEWHADESAIIEVGNKSIGVWPFFGVHNEMECAEIRHNIALIVAMRNALPELLRKLEEVEQWDLINALAELEIVRCERDEAKARVEKDEASRDFLLNCLSNQVDCFGINCPIKEPMPDCAVAVDAEASREDCLKCIKAWAERQAATQPANNI